MRLASLLLVSASLLIGCGQANESDSTAWTALSAAPDDSRATRAGKARDFLASELLKKLGAAIAEGGPANGVDVCQSAAAEIAGKVGASEGVKIGRSSFQLRNPDNQAPAWARASIEEKVGEPKFFAGPDGALGALFPIRLQERCVICHGPKDTIPEPVRDALAKHYPKDEATGFAPGDLRGYFWVEVPH